MFRLRGVNLGSWLLMEGYILGGKNIPEHAFKQNFRKINGVRELARFESLFRQRFITREDLKRIAGWGANCLRVPFNSRLIEKSAYKYSKEGLSLLKGLILEAAKHNLYVVLDLHAAAGAQNCDWHADSSGKALLWKSKDNQERTYALWQYLAQAFKDSPGVYGYDLLNEPVLDRAELPVLKQFYRKLIGKIREVDKKHTIFLEGNLWAQEIEFLKDLLSDRVSVSVHTYQPLDYTFNLRPAYKYPGNISGVRWAKSVLERHLERYKKFSQANRTDIFVGEFGINWRGGNFGELSWLSDTLSIFKEWGFDWTYWTYKAVKNPVFPDGIIQYLENPGWVKREGPVCGWENYLTLWEKSQKKIIDSLDSRNFVENKDILNVLKKYF